jgi:hypothetical protein
MGGAIWTYATRSTSAATVTLYNCTFTNNSAAAGAGADIAQALSGGTSVVNLANNIFANGTGGSLSSNAPINSQGHNLSSDAASGGTGTGPGGFLAGPGDIRNTDPKLDLGYNYNGGFLPTVALLAGSPAIDHGNDSFALPTDARGLARNGVSDIGAFEFAGLLPVSLGNISTRGMVGIGDEVMIGGFIITGSANKTVLIRAIGPSLSNPPFNLAGTLQDPNLSLFSGSTMTDFNDNWADASNAQSIDPNLRPNSGLESAILISLPPGAYTAIVRGANGGTGIGLVEVFDLDATVPSKLGNISTRGLVETGDSVMIGGFVVRGPDNEQVVVRAIGPSLASPPFNLTNVLQNPSLGLFNDQGVRIQFNDDWQSDQANDIIATGLQPSNAAESAIVRTLTPGNYTAIVTGVNGTTGIALVEVYGLN